MMRTAGMFVLAVVLGACRTSRVGLAPDTAAVVPIFGPVIGQEVITGRADEGDSVLLLAGGTDLVRVDVRERRSSRVPLQIDAGKECWGLARLASGALWTLEGRRTIANIDLSGHIVRRSTLDEAHFGIFAAGERLLLQQADFIPPGPALRAGAPDRPRLPWSAITTRTFPAMARASVAALNMITCGPTDTAERACWFPDEPVVFMTTDEGETRRVTLAGLETVPPETLLTSETPRRPVRDAYIDDRGEIWILSSGEPPPARPDVPGGWFLARYAADGTPEGRVRLSEASRLILRIEPARVLVLASSGQVAEVARW
jgi:hypothetical protein